MAPVVLPVIALWNPLGDRAPVSASTIGKFWCCTVILATPNVRGKAGPYSGVRKARQGR